MAKKRAEELEVILELVKNLRSQKMAEFCGFLAIWRFKFFRVKVELQHSSATH